MAGAGVFEGFQGRLGLWKKTSLHLFCDVQFVSGAAFRVQSFRNSTALLVHGVSNLVEADEGKGIAVKILEAGEYTAPDRCLIFGVWRAVVARRGVLRRSRGRSAEFVFETLQARREIEANSALGPFDVFREYVFGDKGNPGGPADELVLWRLGFRCDKCEVGGAIRRSDRYPALAGLRVAIKNELETQLV